MMETDLQAANRLFDEAVRGLVGDAVAVMPEIRPRTSHLQTHYDFARMNAVPIASIEQAMSAVMETCNPYSNRARDPRARLYHQLLFKKLEAQGIVRER